MSCHRVTLLPKITCIPHYSAARLHVELSTRLDTTELTSLYNFTDLDLALGWSPTVERTSPSSADAECPNVGGDVRKHSAQIINYAPIAITWSHATGEDRGWIVSPLPCCCDGSSEYGDTPATLPGVVLYSNPPVRTLSLPTFVPKSTGKKADESGSCFWLGRYLGDGQVQVYMLQGTELVPDQVVECVPIL